MDERRNSPVILRPLNKKRIADYQQQVNAHKQQSEQIRDVVRRSLEYLKTFTQVKK